MKRLVSILILFIVLFSCGESGRKKEAAIAGTPQVGSDKKEQIKDGEEAERRERRDSVMLGRILSEALQISTQNISKDRFHDAYVASPDSDYSVKVDIDLGYRFTKLYPHLIIRRTGPGTVYIDVYTKEADRFEKVLSHEQWGMTYLNDTIRDINGDGAKDFVVNWYGSTGCCLKGFSDVYLGRSGNGTFSKSFEFINPSFSSDEGVIRGVCYGHPGETELYKYKWNGEAVDTLEYLYFEKNDKGKKTGKIIASKHRPFDDNQGILRRLNAIPREYKGIVGYDWFTGEVE